MLIKQLSGSDPVVLEVTLDNAKIVPVSMYLDINQHLHDNMIKIEAIKQHAEGAGILLAMDSNSRSTTWHDMQTNTRGRILEKFPTSNQLHILNDDSDYTALAALEAAVT